ncbi:MAG: ABC transporter permease [Treponema sp.]|nr:ABC transporter permease [Treponema sp.]
MSLNMLLNALSQGLLWGVMAIGVFITFRILNYADLTAEGSFTLGAAVAARLVTMGMDPLVGTLIAIAAGMCAGVVTGFLHTVLRIPPLLSGILAMTGLYSVNLRVMGTPNIPLLRGTETLITRTAALPPVNGLIGWLGITERLGATIVLGLAVLAIVIVVLKLFFNTEIGYIVRATGDNEAMARAQGVNTRRMKVLGLLISNGCIALSGALVFQFQGFADLSMGIGVIVVALASVIIGEVIFNNKNDYRVFIAVVLGSVLYRILIAVVLTLGINPHDFRLFSALILATALSVPLIREKLNFDLKKLLWGRRC